MINVFQLADNDQSVNYLGQIFGNVGVALSGSGPALLANMFKTFNTILLVIGVIFVVYFTVMAVIASAHEGEFMGKKWGQSVWVPIRMLMGIVALVPTQSGYCAIQVIMMWLIVQGIGAADMVWNTTLNYVGTGGTLQTSVPQGQEAQLTLPTSAGAVTLGGTIQELFSSLVCQSVVTKFNGNGLPFGALNNGNANLVAHSKLNSSSTQYTFGRPAGPKDPLSVESECGSVSWWPANGDVAGVGTAETAAMTSLVPVLETIADKFVNNVINNSACWSTPCTSGTTGNCWFKKWATGNPIMPISPPSQCDLAIGTTGWNNVLSFGGSNFVGDIQQMFAGYANNMTVNQNVSNASNTKGSQVNPNLSQTYKQAQANGWLYAGAYYYYIINTTGSSLSDQSAFYTNIKAQPFSTTYQTAVANNMPDFQNFPIASFWCAGDSSQSGDKVCSSTLANAGGAVGLVYQANQALTTAQNTGNTGTPLNLSSGSTGSPLDAVSPAVSGMIGGWMQNLTGYGSNPLIALGNFGRTLLDMSVVIFAYGLIIAAVLGLASSNLVALGTSVNPVYGVAYALLGFVITVVFAICAYMITIGGLLGVYMPLIPFILFTIGSLGWFIAVIEAMIAAPLIAIGMLSPGGQHEILGRAEHSATIVLNVVLRPTLMIFGMMAAMLLSYVIIKIINFAFLGVVSSITGNSVGILTGFLFIMAYAGLVIAALNKTFSLIHIIPDRVLRFIGGTPESVGGAEEAEAVKGKVGAGAEAGAGAAKGVGGAAAGGAQKRGGQHEEGQMGAKEKEQKRANEMADAKEGAKKREGGSGGGVSSGS